MKILILLLLTFNAHAMFLKQSDIGNCQATFYGSKKACGVDCIKQPKNHNCEYMRYGQHQVDDLEKPIYSKSESQACDGQEACQTLLQVKACTDPQEDPFIDEGYTEVYCSKITGYQQKTVTGIYEDASLKSTYTASVAAKQSIEQGIALAAQKRACGQRVIDFIAVLNAQKGITVEQTRVMLTSFNDIHTELKAGALETAQDSLENIDVSGIILDQADINLIIAELQKCM
jgi:hypothetical protein